MENTKEVKNGMYVEMPKVKIGKFTVSQMTDKEGDNNVWIQDTESGEGGQFDGNVIGEDFESLFNKHF